MPTLPEVWWKSYLCCLLVGALDGWEAPERIGTPSNPMSLKILPPLNSRRWLSGPDFIVCSRETKAQIAENTRLVERRRSWHFVQICEKGKRRPRRDMDHINSN